MGALIRRPVEPFMPPAPLAAMVLVIKILVITLTIMVAAPIRISSDKIIPVIGMGLIPGIPPRRIPVSRSHNIDRRISVIRSPSIPGPEIVKQHPI